MTRACSNFRLPASNRCHCPNSGVNVFAGLLADSEKKAWWEHYIAVKLELVENVLNDDIKSEDEEQAKTPSASGASLMHGALLPLQPSLPVFQT